MEDAITLLFLKSSSSRLAQLSENIEACLGRLDDEQIWTRGGLHENAIGNLILHLCGNARQWIVSGVGGAPDVRERHVEFAANGEWTKAQLLDLLRQTVHESKSVIDKLTPGRLVETVTPQGRTVSVLEAIYQMVTHFHLHAGQIMFATKILCGEDLGLYRPPGKSGDKP